MSDRSQHRKKELEDFLRYSQDQMSEEERNAFERSLEQDPFAAEAMEGLSSISPEEAGADLAGLQNRIQKRIDQPSKTRQVTRKMWYRVAAAMAALLVVTSVLFTLFNDRMGQLDRKVAESPELEKEAVTPESSVKTIPIQREADDVAADAPKRKDSDLFKSLTTETGPEVESEIVSNESVEERAAREELVPEKIAREETIHEEPADIQMEEIQELEAEMETPEPAVTEEILADEAAAPYPTPAMAMDRRAAAKSMKRGKVEQLQVAGAAASEHRTVTGMVISGDDEQPLQGVIVAVKGSNTGTITDGDGKFELALEDDSDKTLVTHFIGMESQEISIQDQEDLLISLEPDMVSLDEVVVIARAPSVISQPTGYSVVRTESKTDQVKSDYLSATPVGGKKEFNEYIKSNMNFPENDYGLTRAVVVLNFVIGYDGRPAEILVLKSPGKVFSDEAIRLLMEGPDWQPAEADGLITDQDTRIRILFKND